MGDNRALLEYRRTLRLRMAEYERLRLETALAGLQSEIGLVRSHLLVLENIAEHPPKPPEGKTG